MATENEGREPEDTGRDGSDEQTDTRPTLEEALAENDKWRSAFEEAKTTRDKAKERAREAESRIEAMEKELQKLKRGRRPEQEQEQSQQDKEQAKEFARFKSMYETLLEDHEAVKGQLQSYQQKEAEAEKQKLQSRFVDAISEKSGVPNNKRIRALLLAMKADGAIENDAPDVLEPDLVRHTVRLMQEYDPDTFKAEQGAKQQPPAGSRSGVPNVPASEMSHEERVEATKAMLAEALSLRSKR